MGNKVEKAKVESEIEQPEIKPEHVQVNAVDQVWRTILVRLPENMVADDLRTPSVWKKAQASPQSALIKLDHLFILAFDESFAVSAVVTHASSTEASLSITKVHSFKELGKSFYSDGTLEIFWDGSSYGVRRVSDQVRIISQGFSREDLAVTALRAWYPKKEVA